MRKFVWMLLFPALAWAGAEIGKPAPEFSLAGVDGKTHSLKDYRGSLVVLEWINYDCPFVKKHYGAKNMQSLQEKYASGKIKRDPKIAWLSINSSAPKKQGHYQAEEWKKLNEKNGSSATATLLDPDGKVGKAYGAATTPHMFIIDAKGNLVYAGAIDDRPTPDPRDILKAKNYVAAALDEMLAGKPVSTPVTTAYGCSVKY